MKKILSSVLLVVILLNSFVCANAAADSSDSELPPSGYAVDRNGFSVTAGEFFDELYTLLTTSGSEFCPGEGVISYSRGTEAEEIRFVDFKDLDATYMIGMSSADKDGFPSDDDPFTLITLMADVTTERNLLAAAAVSTAMFYLTSKDIDDFQDGIDFLIELMQNDEEWIQKGAIEYSITKMDMPGSEHILIGIREIAAYK